MRKARVMRRATVALLIPKMRRGECNALETWTLQHAVESDRTLGSGVLKQLLDVPETSTSPYDAWLRAVITKHGYGVKRDPRRAAEILIPHAKTNPLCAALLGVLYNYAGQRNAALDCWRRSAAMECADGIYCLARGSQMDWGVSDPHTIELFHRAAEMAHPGAIAALGHCYRNGHGVHIDVARALHYLEQASLLGCVASTMTMAAVYEHSEQQKNPRRAAFLYCRAMLQDNITASRHFCELQGKYDITPYGEWRPDVSVHWLVPDAMSQQMRTVMLMHLRAESVFSKLPRCLLTYICFWICTQGTGDERAVQE